MKERTRRGVLAALVLLVLFLACVLSVLLPLAGAVQRLEQQEEWNYARRTAAQYISTRVRQSSGAEVVFVGDFHAQQPAAQGDTLFLCEEELCTRIYCSGGYLCELYALRGGDFAQEDGQAILPARQVSFALEEGRLTVELEQQGEIRSFSLQIRGREGTG